MPQDTKLSFTEFLAAKRRQYEEQATQHPIEFDLHTYDSEIPEEGRYLKFKSRIELPELLAVAEDSDEAKQIAEGEKLVSKSYLSVLLIAMASVIAPARITRWEMHQLLTLYPQFFMDFSEKTNEIVPPAIRSEAEAKKSSKAGAAILKLLALLSPEEVSASLPALKTSEKAEKDSPSTR